MSYKATKPGLVSVLYLSMRYMLLLFIRAPFYVLLVFIAMCSVFWLFGLSYQYLPSDWLEKLVCVPILFCFLGQLSHLPSDSDWECFRGCAISSSLGRHSECIINRV